MKKIYLACPYSSVSEDMQRLRFEYATTIAGGLMADGNIVFSPLSHSCPIAEQTDLPQTWEFWSKQDLPFVEWCDELYVIKLKGWESSVGVTAEIELAEELGKAVRYIQPC